MFKSNIKINEIMSESKQKNVNEENENIILKCCRKRKMFNKWKKILNFSNIYINLY